MLIRSTPDVLARRVSVAPDLAAPAHDRTAAELEIDDARRCLPAPELLNRVLEALVRGHPTTVRSPRH